MAYVKIVYQNSPSTATPLNAENLNHMDDQIALNDQRLTEIETSYVKSFNGRKGEVTPQSGDYNIGQIAPLSGAQVGQVPVVVNHGTEQDPELVFEMGAGGGGGHSIIDSEGNTMPQESAMQFADSHVGDDSTNGRTVVENVKEVTLAELSQATERGMYLATDEESVPIGASSEDYVEVVADGTKTYRQLLNDLFALIDYSLVTPFAKLVINGRTTLTLVDRATTLYRFSGETVVDNGNINTQFISINSATSLYMETNNNTPTNVSSSIPTAGGTITLYYGTSSTVINLKTSADYCMMSDGVTSVEGAINNSGKERTYYGIAINDHEFVVLLSSYEIGRGAPASINVSRIVEAAVGGRNYSSHYFDENGLTIVVVSNNLTAGHLIRMTATITW